MALTSILLPVYNGQDYILESVQSVLTQDADFELLIQDDASKDATEEICHGLTDERISYVRNTSNLGCFGSLNAAGARARGDLIRMFSHDDIMLPGDLRSSEEILASHPDCGMTISDYEKIDAEGNVTGSSLDHRDLIEHLPDEIHDSEAAWHLFRWGCISGTQSNITIRRTLFEEKGGFNAAMRISGDFDFLSRCVPSGGLIYNRQVLSKIRFHPQQLSKDGRRHTAYLAEMFQILNQLQAQMDEPRLRQAGRMFKWIYGHQFFNLAIKRLLQKDKSFLEQFAQKSDAATVAQSALVWAFLLPKRILQS